MKKIIYILLLLIYSGLKLEAQIGINTENPQTLFHIDPLKNNTGTTPSTFQQRDDVYLGLGFNDEAVLSLGALPQNNTQLFLNDANKAFLPNKVALTSVLDVVTVPNPQVGMMVYNTVTIVGQDGVVPGLYVYEDSKWKYLFTEDIKKLQKRDLLTALTTVRCNSSDYDCALPLDFGEDIIIPETGAYGVGFNLYSKQSVAVTRPMREIIYVWLMKGNLPVDVAELNKAGLENGGESTYSAFFGGAFNAGDKLSLRISTNNSNDQFIYVYPTRTFMMYWRLEQTSM